MNHSSENVNYGCMSELKPCPMCGAKMKSMKTHDGFYFLGGTHELGCFFKQAYFTPYFTLDQLVSEWNNRPYENKLKAEAVRYAKTYLLNNGFTYGAPYKLDELIEKLEKIKL